MALKGFTKEEEKKFMAGVELTTKMQEYAVEYGYNELIPKLISTIGHIKGGISFSNARDQLSNEVKRFKH
jgi:hypothetical protein